MLRRGVCSGEYMGAWEKFNKRSLTAEEHFYSHLNTEDIPDADFTHVKRACKKLSWFVYSRWYIIVTWCIWVLRKYVI